MDNKGDMKAKDNKDISSLRQKSNQTLRDSPPFKVSLPPADVIAGFTPAGGIQAYFFLLSTTTFLTTQRSQGRAREGPRLFTNLVAVDNVDIEDIEFGMPVEIVFNNETEVKFRPVGKP